MINIGKGAQVQQRSRKMKRTCSKEIFTVFSLEEQKLVWSNDELAFETYAAERMPRSIANPKHRRQCRRPRRKLIMF